MMANNCHKCAYFAPTVVFIILCLSIVEYPTFRNTVHKYSLANRKQNEHIFAKMSQMERQQRQQPEQQLQQNPYYHHFQQQLKKYKDTKKLFYNRVRKCKSVTTLALFKKLSVRNEWHFTKKFWPPMQGYCARRMRYWTHDFPMVKGVAKHVLDAPTPGVAQGHVHYIDFSKIKNNKKPLPVYINLIRKPFERLVSSFYYMRRTNYKRLPNNTRDLTYDECVSNNVTECIKADPSGYFTLIPWFCGHDPVCLYPNEDAIQRAKSNVEKHYAIIGLNEHYPEFLHALELTFPQFFRGAVKIFTKMREDEKRKRQITQPLRVPSNSTKERLNNLLQDEMEFYQFIKQRFFLQYNILKSLQKAKKEPTKQAP